MEKEKAGDLRAADSGMIRAKSKFRITIEPYLFISIFGMMLTYLTMQNLMLDKACRVNLNFTSKDRDASWGQFHEQKLGVKFLLAKFL